MKFSVYQIEMMKSALQGYCYDANPLSWDDQSERNQMEQLVIAGYMYKPKNHRADTHGFYALTPKGKEYITRRKERLARGK